MIKAIDGKTPRVAEGCFIAENAVLVGDVTVMEDASVWYGAVLRGDAEPIVIGRGSNVQDCAVMHCDRGHPITIGENVTVGHSAIVHGSVVEDGVLVGMHATLMNGCVIGKGSIVAAGALVKEGQIIPPGSLAVGVPAKVLRPVSEEQRQQILRDAAHYVEQAEKHKKEIVL